jgi:hypothetical protein
MSALGQKRTYAPQQTMSALHPKADMCGANTNVCFGPKADIPVVLTYRADPASEVFHKRTPYRPVILPYLPARL